MKCNVVDDSPVNQKHRMIRYPERERTNQNVLNLTLPDFFKSNMFCSITKPWTGRRSSSNQASAVLASLWRYHPLILGL